MSQQGLSKYFLLCMLLLGTAVVVFSPEAAFAAMPFASGSNTVKADIISFVTPLIGVAIIALGLACGFGKLSWWWFGGVVVGVILVYGHEQIISWLRGAFGI